MYAKGKRENPEHSWLSTMSALLKGGALAFVIASSALFLCAVAVANRWLSQGGMDAAVIAACVFGSLLGGLLSVRHGTGKTLLTGLGVGGVLFLLLLTAGFFFYGSADFAQGDIGLLLACGCGGGLAGVLGRTKKKRRR